ncbi:MAG: alpha-galactosidase [Clostridia bacterium]
MRRFIMTVMLLCMVSLMVACVSKNDKGEETMTEYNNYLTNLGEFPITFKYDGKSYRGFKEDFSEVKRDRYDKDSNGKVTVVYMTHEPSGAEFRLETCVYKDYNAWDYTLYITNNTDKTTGVFSDINAIDMYFKGEDPIIKGISGDLGKDMYSPYEIKLVDGVTFSRESTSGRPTHGVFPYFKLEYGKGGSFIAIGWPGCWKMQASANGDEVHFSGGQMDISTYLNPGETIRTPLVAILNFNTRDDNSNLNIWRKWFIDCNMRKVNGENMPPLFVDFALTQGLTTNDIIRKIKAYADHGVPLDCYWMDAGWYTDAEGNTVEWPLTGTLMIDEKRFPDRFASISEELAKTGGKLLLWFEPEVVRVNKDQFLNNINDFDPSWFLGTAAKGTWLEGQLMDLGNPQCREWILNRITKIIKEANIAIYRQDFNVDPGPVWREHDTENRTGYIENRYVMGYLEMWDTIIETFPEIWIDSCASGGGRNDLETMRRSVPLQISDYWDGNPDGYDERQATMLTVMQWFPYIKFWIYGDDSAGSLTYRARSCYTQIFPLSVNTMSKSTDWDLVKKLVNEWRKVSTYFYDDFYPLTPWNNSSAEWRAYQYFSPERDSGVAQVFRPSESTEPQKNIRFHGVNPDRMYRVYDTDGTFETTVSGKVLLDEGLTLTLPEVRYAMVLFIENAE